MFQRFKAGFGIGFVMQSKYLAALVVSVAAWLVPVTVFASGEHGTNEMSFSVGPFPAALGVALAVTAGAYMIPTIQVNMLQLLIVATGTVTAVLHLILGVGGELLLLLNALGYVALLVALFAPTPQFVAQRPMLRIALLVYTAITFVAYFLLHSIEQYGTLDIATKAIEMALIVLLIVRLVQLRKATDGTETA